MISSVADLARCLDATLLRADASPAQVAELAREARRDGCAAVCVAPARLPAAAAVLAGSSTALAAAIAFPNGATTLGAKSFEALEALRLGATELDVVLDLAAVAAGDTAALAREMAAIMERTPEAVHKFIVETAWLPEPAWVPLSRVFRRLRPAYFKTGTGVHGGPVAPATVARLRQLLGDEVGIKAAGGIRTVAAARELVAAGAGRLGTSAAAAMLRALAADPDGACPTAGQTL